MEKKHIEQLISWKQSKNRKPLSNYSGAFFLLKKRPLNSYKDSNNLRDCYIRALSLGEQQEELGQEIKESAIRRAFRHAGELNRF